MRTLDIEAVQAFVLVADLKSFTRAAEALETTQSAISLKIKRLEDGIGRRLLERTPRMVRLSLDGDAFLTPARALVAAHQSALTSFDVAQRRLVIGISDLIFGADLPVLLKRMNSVEPGLMTEMRVGSSSDILDSFNRGDFDAAIVFRHDKLRCEGEVILEEQFGWMAAPDFAYRPGEKLRLAGQSDSCVARTIATAALDSAGIGWTEVFVGGGIATIGGAVSSSLAVAALSRRVAPPDTIDVGQKFGLPPLPPRDVILCSNLTDRRARNALRTLAAVIRSSTP